MGENQQRLAAAVEAVPAGTACGAVLADQLGEPGQSASGQRDRGGVRQHSEAPGRGIGSWSTAVLPGASPRHLTNPGHGAVTSTITMKIPQLIPRRTASRKSEDSVRTNPT